VAVLGRSEIDKGIRQGQYIKNPRTIDGKFPDLQSASYDLTAGVAVWRESGRAGLDGATRESRSLDDAALHQPTVELQPGQMMSIITKEELAIPADVCATVYSKNSIALKGIFAFNAGHVDPGYKGPIIVRLLNLRRTKLTLTMGQPIFLIVFEKLDQEADITASPSLSHEKALLAVRDFANDALSNALFELYAGAIEERLDNHKNSLLDKVRSEFDERFVQKENLRYHLWVAIGIAVAALVTLAAALVNIVSRWPDFVKVLHGAR
jgi:deoxycytidine triphosphate deaminase